VRKRTWWFGAGLLVALAVLIVGSAPSAGKEEKAKKTFGKIERLDARLDKLIPKDAVIEQLAEGFIWTEGPVWVPKDGGYLLFSDIPMNTVFKWQEGKGVSEYMKPSGYTGSKPRGGKAGDEPGSNGLILDPQGRLVLCEHGDRRVSREEKDGKKTTLADKYMGKRLNSPNDGVYKSNGDLYFTDPPYGLPKRGEDPTRELNFNGVFRLSKDGKLTLLTKDMTYPNGIAFSPDEKTLYVANSDPKKAIWMAFPVKKDGTLGEGKVFFDSTKWANSKPGLPDGMKVDKAGNLFATGPGGVFVFAPDGTHLGTIATGDRTSNCNWGNDGTVLYITVNHRLARIKLSTTGKGF
jgi:gluconolactonase